MTDSLKKPPTIDIDMLTMALQAGDLETIWWLDIHSGEVMPAPEHDGDAVEQKLLKEKQRSPDRYIDIEPIADAVHNELMESYIATIEENSICESLYEALQHKQPAWHFKNALARHPECEDNWYAFKEQFYALQARQWLRDRELEVREKTADEVPQQKNPAELLYTETPEAQLELAIALANEQRRYMLWQQDGQVILTVFVVEGDQEEKIMSEIQINEHQLSGINRIVETCHPSVDMMPVIRDTNVCLRFGSQSASGEICGVFTVDGVYQQLALMLDMLLGIPAIQAE